MRRSFKDSYTSIYVEKKQNRDSFLLLNKKTTHFQPLFGRESTPGHNNRSSSRQTITSLPKDLTKSLADNGPLYASSTTLSGRKELSSTSKASRPHKPSSSAHKREKISSGILNTFDHRDMQASVRKQMDLLMEGKNEPRLSCRESSKVHERLAHQRGSKYSRLTSNGVYGNRLFQSSQCISSDHRNSHEPKASSRKNRAIDKEKDKLQTKDELKVMITQSGGIIILNSKTK